MTDAVPDRTVRQFLDALAARTSAPAAGAGAALTVGAAAALVAMAARFTESPLSGLAERADRLREEVLLLADADGEAYVAALAALRLPRQQPERQQRITTAMQAATEVPLAIARAGSEIATMAAKLASEGNPNLVGDAQAAALLAEGAVNAAVRIVQLNQKIGGLDGTWTDQADACLRMASDATRTSAGRAP
ncbi:cyclodeaminase/cyclohydrolase family protein [Planosporangium flavigriseum]|uniref:Cyclodeaminase/cyclohydrolase domain-containing protein n=1 Tax=Planosporangium flavigriseum TaxID=373681 RepID=A0A8J3LWD8_9ACTN|nr:cyclodeaminase/cyclohydrolase family protein [Planosporangium flavigriseum]NJC65524.1 cyclodeaminase/cyclohydrolase family protein [Planosporangium flavigriseum]GIG75039.1 hypothetical protein Pfl04_34430 [Planosporangium flavigriseum]